MVFFSNLYVWSDDRGSVWNLKPKPGSNPDVAPTFTPTPTPIPIPGKFYSSLGSIPLLALPCTFSSVLFSSNVFVFGFWAGLPLSSWNILCRFCKSKGFVFSQGMYLAPVNPS